jgi:hypothetical protein
LIGIRLKVREVSHGRVLFDTHNEVRFTAVSLSGLYEYIYRTEAKSVSFWATSQHQPGGCSRTSGIF